MFVSVKPLHKIFFILGAISLNACGITEWQRDEDARHARLDADIRALNSPEMDQAIRDAQALPPREPMK